MSNSLQSKFSMAGSKKKVLKKEAFETTSLHEAISSKDSFESINGSK